MNSICGIFFSFCGCVCCDARELFSRHSGGHAVLFSPLLLADRFGPFSVTRMLFFAITFTAFLGGPGTHNVLKKFDV